MRVVRDGVIQWLEGEYAGCVGGLPEGGTFWIGSGEGCDIPLYGADIAPYHLGIACDSEYDGFFVMCFEPDSVFLENGTPLLPEQEQWIPSGTILILGSGRNRICPVREGEDGEFIPEGEEPRRGAGKKIALAAGLVCAVVLLGVGAWKLGFLNGGFGTSLAGMEEEEETDSEETEYTPQPEKTIQYAEDCVVYRPADEALAYDEDTCTIYYNNVLAVYLTEEITDEAKTALANAVGGKIVGEMSGSIDLMQIQVPESDLAQLNSYAESLKDAEYVMCATYEVPMILSETETYADQNPWADPTDDDYEKKVQAGIEGNEEEPQGNNWWAEAIGAYTAWNCEFERQPMTVAVIDTGFYLSNEDLL